MPTQAVNRIVGDLVEDLVAEFVAGPRASDFDITEATKLAVRNVPRGARQSVASALHTKLHRYITRCAPSFQWRLIDTGVRIGFDGVEVDFVLESIEGMVVVEELKAFTPRQARGGRITDQVARQLKAGVEEYADDFLGVRWITLDFPHHSGFFVPGQVTCAAFPDGLEAS